MANRLKTSAVRCILFDLDGTLYDSPQYSQKFETEIASFVSEKLSIDPESARTLLNERRREHLTLTRALKSLGIDRDIFFESMAARIDPAEHISEDLKVQEVISTLRAEGFKVGLVSNSGRPLVEKILEALQLDSSSFDTIITSSEVQPKPSREPFLLAMKSMSCRSENAIYVGDRDEAELRPAKEIGIRTILLDRSGGTSPCWADAVVRNLSEIPKVANEIL